MFVEAYEDEIDMDEWYHAQDCREYSKNPGIIVPNTFKKLLERNRKRKMKY